MDAINAVKNGESVKEAERIYGIPKSTLADTLNKKYKIPGKPGRRQTIPQEVENKIANAVKEVLRQGIGITRRQLLIRVGELSRKIKFAFKSGKPGKDCFATIPQQKEADIAEAAITYLFVPPVVPHAKQGSSTTGRKTATFH